MPLPLASRFLPGTIGVVAASAMVAALTGAPAAAAPAEADILSAGGATALPGSYIVVFEDSAAGTASRGAVASTATALAGAHGGTVEHVYSAALPGFSARLSERAARRLAADPAVKYVEQNHAVGVTATQTNPPWGLDRINQRDLPLNNKYGYTSTGSGVTAYILDTGIRTTHSEFGGRAVHGFDAVDGALPADDCNGHGTHVAGTTGGATYGVAKDVTLVAVRVLNCAGSGSYAQVIAGIDYVTADHDAGELAVANMSLGGGLSTAVNDAVTASIADGVSYAVAAGNSNADACNFTPASTPNAITVGATQSNDARASYSNWGTCLDIFAPGSGVLSAWYTSDTATATLSGTSMAAPHVAGAAARVLSVFPTRTPAQVRNYLVNRSSKDKVTNPGVGSPNNLLFLANSF